MTRSILLFALLGLAACGGGGSDTPSGNSFVQSQIADGTNDVAEPVDINGSNLQFSESPTAFDSLFQ